MRKTAKPTPVQWLVSVNYCRLDSWHLYLNTHKKRVDKSKNQPVREHIRHINTWQVTWTPCQWISEQSGRAADLNCWKTTDSQQQLLYTWNLLTDRWTALVMTSKTMLKPRPLLTNVSDVKKWTSQHMLHSFSYGSVSLQVWRRQTSTLKKMIWNVFFIWCSKVTTFIQMSEIAVKG